MMSFVHTAEIRCGMRRSRPPAFQRSIQVNDRREHICRSRSVPPSRARPPPPHVAAIVFVVYAELLAQGRLFIEEDKQVHAQRNRRYGDDHSERGVSEDSPQPNPSNCEAHVHRVPHVAIEADRDKPLRRGDRRRSSTSRPAKIPHTAQSHRESHHRWDLRKPSPARCPCCFHPEAEPTRQKPEP